MGGDDLFNRITSQRGRWENLLTRIPLLGGALEGYLDMSARRDVDRIIREHVAGLLGEQIGRMAQVENMILDSGGLSHMSKTRSAKTKLQTLRDRINTAAPGYTGFFDGTIRIGEDQLAQIYAFDEAMLDYVDKIREKLDALQNAAMSNEGIGEAITALETMVIEANTAYGQRENLLTRAGQSDV